MPNRAMVPSVHRFCRHVHEFVFMGMTGPSAARMLWFAGLWLAGVAAVALVGLLIRSVLM